MTDELPALAYNLQIYDHGEAINFYIIWEGEGGGKGGEREKKNTCMD